MCVERAKVWLLFPGLVLMAACSSGAVGPLEMDSVPSAETAVPPDIRLADPGIEPEVIDYELGPRPDGPSPDVPIDRGDWNKPCASNADCESGFCLQISEEESVCTITCVEECPNDALTFGDRDELLQIARTRIYGNPDGYVPHIYGEHEAGGTSLLYISPVPFEELGFRTDLGETAYPEYTRDFLTAVPLVLIIWPAMLLGLRQAATQAGSEAVDAELLEGGDV